MINNKIKQPIKKRRAKQQIHHFDEPRTPGAGTSFGVTDLLLRMSVMHGVEKKFFSSSTFIPETWLNPSRAKQAMNRATKYLLTVRALYSKKF